MLNSVVKKEEKDDDWKFAKALGLDPHAEKNKKDKEKKPSLKIAGSNSDDSDKEIIKSVQKLGRRKGRFKRKTSNASRNSCEEKVTSSSMPALMANVDENINVSSAESFEEVEDLKSSSSEEGKRDCVGDKYFFIT